MQPSAKIKDFLKLYYDKSCPQTSHFMSRIANKKHKNSEKKIHKKRVVFCIAGKVLFFCHVMRDLKILSITSLRERQRKLDENSLRIGILKPETFVGAIPPSLVTTSTSSDLIRG